MNKMLKIHVKSFYLMSKASQASYSVHRQVLFNSISVIAGPEEGDNVGLCAIEPCLRMQTFHHRPDLSLGLLHWDSRALDKEYFMILFLISHRNHML